jgi:CRP-like cAMP-binding protein
MSEYQRRTVSTSEFRAANLPGSVELFRGLDSSNIDLILSAARHRHFSEKSVITYQGESSDGFLLLWKGRARYFFETPNGKKLILRWIMPGQVFGVASFVSEPSRYLVSTEAVRDCMVLVWDGPTIRAFAGRFSRLFENVLLIATDYISWYVAAHASLTSHTARERLAHVLVALAPSVGQKVPGGVELHISNEELSNSANITAYTASRIMSLWQRNGAICKRRGKILLCSAEKLFAGD